MPVDTSRLTRVAAFVLQRRAPQIYNAIKRNDAIVALLGAKQRIEMQTGGDLFKFAVELAENPNFAWRSKYAPIDTNIPDVWRNVSFGQAVLDGAAVLNEIEEAQNAGTYAESDLVKGMVTNAERTAVRKLADGLRNAAPGANEPNSVVSLIEATAFGSQTSTTGDLVRSMYPTQWQNQRDNTSIDISAAAGLRDLESFMLQNLTHGAAKSEQVDFGITRPQHYARLSSLADNLRRWQEDATLAQLGFNSIKVLGAGIISDPSMPANRLYLLNTNYLFLKILRTPGQQQVGDNPESVPLSVKDFVEEAPTLNKVAKMYVVLNLCVTSLRHQGVNDNVT